MYRLLENIVGVNTAKPFNKKISCKDSSELNFNGWQYSILYVPVYNVHLNSSNITNY